MSTASEKVTLVIVTSACGSGEAKVRPELHSGMEIGAESIFGYAISCKVPDFEGSCYSVILITANTQTMTGFALMIGSNSSW